MFGLLKNKFKEFTSKIFGKGQEKVEETKEEEQAQAPVQEPTQIQEQEKPISQTLTEPITEKQVLKEVVQDKQKEVITEKHGQSEPKIEVFSSKEEELDDFDKELAKELEQFKEEPAPKIEAIKVPEPKPIPVSRPVEVKPIPVSKPIDIKPIQKETVKESPKAEPLPIKEEIEKEIEDLKEEVEEEGKEKEESIYSERYEELKDKKPEKVKTGVFTAIKSLFVSRVSLSEKEIKDFLEDFEISLLEADVSLDASHAIVEDLKLKLSNAKFSKSNLLEDIKKEIKISLSEQLNIDCEINNYIKKENNEPLVIMFIGPNGAGKTTTISKFANLYKKQGKLVFLASSDTFRAGAIDQLEVHASRLEIKVIKQGYGSDPAAVAFDAVTSAKANKADVVLIDTAGRQETNINLMQELQKIKRVVKPHLTIYIGESQSGQAIVDQVKNFDKDIGVTGVILTKIDTDPKGGVAISILNELKKPIFYIGTGQEYNDIEKFSPEYIIERIV
ncbi:MAG: signal recognition particle-docking protein FtsY [archaeon]